MSQDDLVLKWNDHGSSLAAVFENLRRDNVLVDCTLAAEEQQLAAHKLVLSACSSYFEMLFKGIEGKHPIVILKDIKFSDLKAVIDFMYSGEVQILQEQLTSFLKTAQCLRVTALASIGARDVIQKINLACPPTDPLTRCRSTSPEKSRAPQQEGAPEFEFVAVDDENNQSNSSAMDTGADMLSVNIPSLCLNPSMSASWDTVDPNIFPPSFSLANSHFNGVETKLPLNSANSSISPAEGTSSTSDTLADDDEHMTDETDMFEKQETELLHEVSGQDVLSDSMAVNSENDILEPNAELLDMKDSISVHSDVTASSSDSSEDTGSTDSSEPLLRNPCTSNGATLALQAVHESPPGMQQVEHGCTGTESVSTRTKSSQSPSVDAEGADSPAHSPSQVPSPTAASPNGNVRSVMRKTRKDSRAPVTNALLRSPSPAKQSLRCRTCGMIFTQRERLYRHKRLHVLEKQKHFTCATCLKRFFTKALVEEHIVTGKCT